MTVYRLFYGYVDYTIDGRPYYVGIGSKARAELLVRNEKHTRVSAKHGQVRKVIAVGHVWAAMCAWEKATIRALSTRASEQNIGCNFTDGGDGTPGVKPQFTASHRLHMSEAAKRRAPITEKTRQKCREAFERGRQRFTAEGHERRAAAHRGRKRSDTTRLRQRQASAARWSNGASHQQASDGQRRRWDRVHRERVTELLHRMFHRWED